MTCHLKEAEASKGVFKMVRRTELPEKDSVPPVELPAGYGVYSRFLLCEL